MADSRRSVAVRLLLVGAAAMTAGGEGAAEPQGRRAPAPIISVRPIAWAEAGATVERFENALPPSLRDIPRAERPAQWPAWLANRRRELAARVAQGDVDSVVNLV